MQNLIKGLKLFPKVYIYLETKYLISPFFGLLLITHKM